MTICKMVMIKYIPVIEWIMLYFEILHLNLIFQIHYWDLYTETSLIMNMSFLVQRCPKKKCELLLLLQVVIHTFFWNTL